ncbi:MAG: site-specific recombinase XerD, partial [Paenibacillus sp.]|nr:site-specific recombinase XerD [Paenibacillus sp.]
SWKTQRILVKPNNNSVLKIYFISSILDCKAKNLSPLTLRFYQDSAKQMKEAFLAQQVPFNIYMVLIREIKNHFIESIS